MPSTVCDGIETRYELEGSGPPLLMFSPGGFNARLGNWRTQGIYATTQPLTHLSTRFTCILFDRRESGESGGRVEAVTWADYVRQGKALLDHLKIERAHVMGACMGVSPACAFGVAHPETTESLVLYWPVGGAHYRISSRARFAQHLAYLDQHGLAGVVSLAQAEGKPFTEDPRGGPWASVITRDAAFARAYAALDQAQYVTTVTAMRDTLFDRDTALGPNAEDLFRVDIPAFIIPGRDKAHATSAARYLEECLPRAEYWDAPVADQTESAVATRLLGFLGSH